MPDISIVIAHRGPLLGLWTVLHSCIEDLLHSPEITYNFIVVSNGDPLDKPTESTLHLLGKDGKLLHHLHFDEALTPPAARQRGAAVADGDYLCFFDNHCLVARDFFRRVLYDFSRRDMDILHSTTKFTAGTHTEYHYRLKLAHNFWAESSPMPTNSALPYRIAAAGHGGFVVKRSTWEEVGGYGPESLFEGYGGEELLFDLKMGRMGKSNWIDPLLIHYHFPGVRSYSKTFTEEYYINLLSCANAVGGESWMYKVYDSFVNKTHLRINHTRSWFDLLMVAQERSTAYSKVLDSTCSLSLDDLLTKFRIDCISS